ncbi:MAG: PQQ-dependent sugar dehydrogenase [Angustibacter sp.]
MGRLGVHRRTAAAALLLLGLAACSDAGAPQGAAAPSRTPSTTPSATASATATATATASNQSPATTIASVSVVARHLAVPWGLARLDDGSYLVSLRDEARVVRVTPGGQVTPVPATGRDGRVAGVRPEGEGGLLGLAFAPGDQRTLYAYVTSERDNRVVSMPYRDGRLGPLTPLLTGIPKAGNHNGGRLAFGPDGMLYVTTGDAGERPNAQDKKSLGGKILRITRSGAPAPGNPFPGSTVWSYGHRNVQGIGWDAAGRMYASEFGQNTWDELNRIEPGRNYGWPVVEGMGTDADVARGFTRPLAVWPTDDASPSGIAVGRGAVWMAALRGERLWRVPLGADGSVGRPEALLQGRYGRLRAAVLDPTGDLVVITSNRSRGDPTADDDRLLRLRLR